MMPGSRGETSVVPAARPTSRMLKTTAIAQEMRPSAGASQESRSLTRPQMMAASPRSSAGFKLPHVNPRTASNGSATHFFSLDLESSCTTAPLSTPKACSPQDLVPSSRPAPKLPCMPPSSPPPMDLIPPLPSSALSPEPCSPPGISILERLIKTCPIWLQLGMSPERVELILHKEKPGIFLVGKNPALKKMVLSVRLCDQEGEPQVQDLLIKEEKSLVYLEGSVLVFDDIFKLIAFYCVSRDILPFKLRLPQVIIQATKHEDMEMMSSLGSEFWGSSLNRCAEEGKPCCGPAGRVPRAVAHGSQDLSEMEPSAGGDRLWYVNPIFIEEHCSSLPIIRSQSLTTPGPAMLRYKRPAPLPPRPHASEEHPFPGSVPQCAPSQVWKKEEEGSSEKASMSEQLLPCSSHTATSQRSSERRIPPVPPRRKLSDKQILEEREEEKEEEKEEEEEEEENGLLKEDEKPNLVPIATLVSIDDASTTKSPSTGNVSPTLTTSGLQATLTSISETSVTPTAKPVPPPRRKRQTLLTEKKLRSPVSEDPSRNLATLAACSSPLQTSSSPTPTQRSGSSTELQGSDASLFSPEGRPPQLDPDSYSTSSAEEDPDLNSSNMATIKRSSTIMLDKAKQRLSMVNLSHIFTSFMSGDKKLKKRIVALALDRESYFGNLVRDYHTYTLETMQKHSSSTEMLQEIRLMMTQLKSYLIQSAELKSLLEPLVPPEEKLEAIIEAALCKSVLKPLREAIYSRLHDIHRQDGSLDRIWDNQQVVLNTTTTDLGVTTSVPEAPAMDKIQLKLGSLYKEYSPEKKISLLLKTCKIIYESMSVSSPGKPYGADDFLPVLMYVLARCNMATLLLDVEYMMELMDPALQLGEGSYYLTTTYGALEHIKNYDKLEVTGQFSIEIQDSIHRWERRRTLNKARVSRISVQDFINVSFLEAGSNTKTLGAHPGTTALDICTQCAKKFEVLEPECYGLFVLVEGCYQALLPNELPLSLKSKFHHSDPRKEYYFVYRPGGTGKEAVLPKPDSPPDSLI